MLSQEEKGHSFLQGYLSILSGGGGGARVSAEGHFRCFCSGWAWTN